MLPTDATLYLPLSERMLAPILSSEEPLVKAASSLTIPQLAAILVLQNLPRVRENPSVSPEWILREFIKAANEQVRGPEGDNFLVETCEQLDREKILRGYDMVLDFGIVLLDEETAQRRGYLEADGNWDYQFRHRHRERLIGEGLKIILPNGTESLLMTDQRRVFREAEVTDDHLHVQGFAGTGKSSLIRALITLLLERNANVLILGDTKRQLEALLDGIDEIDGRDKVNAMTFGQLAAYITPPDLTAKLYIRMRHADHGKSLLKDEDLVQHMGINAVGRFSARAIARAARAIVASYCYSGDEHIGTKHVPVWCDKAFDISALQVALHHANQLWQSTLAPPSQEFRPPVRAYHQVKFAAINGWSVPAQFTHVLIDECHNLPKPVLQILDNSPQQVTSLGDVYQNLQGSPRKRADTVRQRTMQNSVRSGTAVEGIVQPLVAVHPIATDGMFSGNRFQKTDVEYYQKAEVPEQPITILAADMWEIFEWAQRLAAKKVQFGLLSSRDDISKFVSDCIELHERGTRPRHGEIFRFTSWDNLSEHYHANSGFQRINQMLQNGYSTADWRRTLERIDDGVRKSGYQLGLVADVRNQEYDAVMLAPELGKHVWDTQGRNLAVTGSAIYVAVTRAKRKLFVPETLRNWVEEVTATNGRMKFATALNVDLTPKVSSQPFPHD